MTIYLRFYKIISKYYIDKNCIVREYDDYKIVVENCGFGYLLDDDGDYLVYGNPKYDELLNDIENLPSIL